MTAVPFEAAAPGKKAPPVELGLITDDHEAMAANAILVKPPARKPQVRKTWGQLVGYVRDRTGFLVEICPPVGD